MPGIRFYAGVPLRLASGLPLGTLCVADIRPRRISAAQREALEILARQVVARIERRRDAGTCLEAVRPEGQAAPEQRLKMIHASRLSSLGEMAASIAHEINNPLAIIRGRIQILADQARAGAVPPDELLKACGKIEATATRIARIVAGMRALARDGAGDPFAPAPVASILHDTIELCQMRFRNHGVRIEVGAVDPELAIECRSVQVAQVLLNLMSNAYDACQETPAGQARWIRIDVRDEGERVALAVCDSGPGVAPGARARLMQSFFTTKGPGKGTGLGLSVSRAIAEQHRGTLELDAASRFTRFVLRLPKRQATGRERKKAG
jgi:C4-dicarboxylate-specific signal transduction histidine kinase